MENLKTSLFPIMNKVNKNREIKIETLRIDLAQLVLKIFFIILIMNKQVRPNPVHQKIK